MFSKIQKPSTSDASLNESHQTNDIEPNEFEPSGIVNSFFEFDLGEWIGKSYRRTSAQKSEMLKRCWNPPPSYNFSLDAHDKKRVFIHSWLSTYSPWLAYSMKLKGALCLYCVLFPPTTVQGVLGAFMITPFVRYKHMHDACKNHASSKWHLDSTKAAKSFVEDIPVNVQVISEHKKLKAENRKILTSIISTVIFCGTHDLALRGHDSDSGKNAIILSLKYFLKLLFVHDCLGVFHDLIRLKIESGDSELQNHIEKGKRNALYTSVQIQNEIIDLCGQAIKANIIDVAKQAVAYSILADETCDISGKEQLSVGIRFFDDTKKQTIATAIDQYIQGCGLDPHKCVGQGYDGCSTMAGNNAGVQKLLQKTYPKGLFFHCASHKLNLVVNYLNSVPEIRNTISTIKAIINFFRESVVRRRYVPNVPAFCETRWSEKYKSIRIFKV